MAQTGDGLVGGVAPAHRQVTLSGMGATGSRSNKLRGIEPIANPSGRVRLFLTQGNIPAIIGHRKANR